MYIHLFYLCNIFDVCKEVPLGFLYVYIFYYFTCFQVSDSINSSYLNMSPKPPFPETNTELSFIKSYFHMNNCCEESQWKMVVIEYFIYFCVLEGNDLSLSVIM